MALNFEQYFANDINLPSHSANFSIVYTPATGGARALITINNQGDAGALNVTRWELFADKAVQLNNWKPSYETAEDSKNYTTA